MINVRRMIYGLPAMRWYRRMRARSAFGPARMTRDGFMMAGADLFFDPQWEVSERRIVADFLPDCSTFIDVGANHGFYSLLGARSGKNVVAVEPEEGNLILLRSNVAINQAEVEVQAAALSASTGTASLYGDGDMASMDRQWQGVGKGFRQKVATTTLDKLVAGRWPGERLFIKIDVEGFEDQVLRGATATLARSPRPFWLVETYPRRPTGGYSPAFKAVFEIMHAAGYEGRLASDLDTRVTAADVEQWDRDPIEDSNFLFRA